MPKFGRKVPHLIDATRVPVSRSNGQRSGLEADGGIPCGPLAEPGGRTACWIQNCWCLEVSCCYLTYSSLFSACYRVVDYQLPPCACGRLSWLPVSLLLHVKYTLSYRIAFDVVVDLRSERCLSALSWCCPCRSTTRRKSTASKTFVRLADIFTLARCSMSCPGMTSPSLCSIGSVRRLYVIHAYILPVLLFVNSS